MLQTLLAVCALGLLYHLYILSAASISPLVSTDASTEAAIPRNGQIPKSIWYKLGPRGLSKDMRAWSDTCILANPAYHAEFMTDDSSDAWVNKTFSATRPDLVEDYLALSVPIFKADILRYLLLWAEGGIWFDLDVSCDGIPMDAWIPDEYKDSANVVVGWEFDHGFEGAYFHQLASWTIMSAPRSPHMLQVIDDFLHRYPSHYHRRENCRAKPHCGASR